MATTHSGTDVIPCPDCGAPIRDLWDHDWTGAEDEARATECAQCGVDIALSRCVSVIYKATTADATPKRRGARS